MNLTNEQFFILLTITGGTFWALKVWGSDAFNPVNRDNIFARGVNAIGDVLNDGQANDNFELGRWVYNATRLDELERE